MKLLEMTRYKIKISIAIWKFARTFFFQINLINMYYSKKCKWYFFNITVKNYEKFIQYCLSIYTVASVIVYIENKLFSSITMKLKAL